MYSRELGGVWPNGIRLAYRQQFGCGHFVTVWTNHPDPIVLKGTEGPDWHVDSDLKRRVLDAGCIKCEEPKEPLDYQHKGRGGFLRNYPASLLPIRSKITRNLLKRMSDLSEN